MTTAPALEISGLNSGYGESVVIRDVNVEVGSGEIFAILGKNGMGKSTLLLSLIEADLAAGRGL